MSFRFRIWMTVLVIIGSVADAYVRFLKLDPDACDDRECGTDASMDYEHEVATDGGRDAADTEDLWSRR